MATSETPVQTPEELMRAVRRLDMALAEWHGDLSARMEMSTPELMALAHLAERSAGADHAALPHRHGAHRHLPGKAGPPSQLQRGAHELFVGAHRRSSAIGRCRVARGERPARLE